MFRIRLTINIFAFELYSRFPLLFVLFNSIFKYNIN